MVGFDSVGSFLNSNRKNIEMLLTVLILFTLMPDEVLGFNIKSQIKPVVDPVMNIMRNSFVQFFIFVFSVYSCCIKPDTSLFLLLSVFLLATQ